jgi:hypothetical protein
MVDHKINLNANWGVPQGGDYVVVGARSGTPTAIHYNDVRTALTTGSGRHIAFFDDFLGNIGVQPTPGPKTAGSTGTALIEGAAGVAGGAIKLLTAATSADYTTIAVGAHWSATSDWLFYETSVKLGQLTATTFETGMSDAISETAGLAFSDHTVASVTDVATDGFVFAYDSAAGANWLINTVKNGTPQAYNTGVAANTSSYVRLTARINVSGDITFFVDDTLITTLEDAITPTVLVTPWASIVATAAAAKNVLIDYVSVSGTR